ncbi:hypothetical protein ERO13_A08G209300v2 [Gossypium hirsutum]|uniref:Uncharacterized protein isoform X1 n=1 Tax=Gossypium hirsutum TaxID=3635 RepID=A0A1U8IA22_GOSHI|nr:uncharacterized protein LOC107894224 isoform X1 [Gossypium hirsutum]KAG4189155.1 hypothetical protein ERO13_A08G209300v2 [Gossypium hirsutum]
METIQVDPNCNLTQETSPKQLLPPDSPDISDIFGDSQLSPRVGNRYQAEIPPMIAGWEHLQLLMNSEGSPYIDHSFIFSLAVPVTWIHEQDIDFEDEGKEGPSKPDDATKVARKCRKGQNSKRKKNSELSAERSNARLVDEKESNAENLECGMAPCGGKSSHLIPGSSSDAWNNTEADSFLLGLYIFGKDFGKIKQLIGNKKMGDILSFYYGAFYKSDRYRRWSSGQKRRNRRIICGRKIFTGWRQQKLLSRLLTHVQDELQNNFLEQVSKSFVEGRTSLENYVFHLKDNVGICNLVEAVGIGKGKVDLTGLAMEPPRTTQVSPEIPSGKACSSLTCGEILGFLTAGCRLSKARCNDIFWEAVWPRLLARGWHSEQPKNQCSFSSKHCLVFLIPGVKKFSRRKLVKGNHYFDSVSDVLSKVVSEPTLIELDAEGNDFRSCNGENSCLSGESSDQDDLPNHKPHYLKPRVSIFSSNHMKFTVVDSSLVHGGKASKMRELRCSPIDLMFTSKPMQKVTQDSGQVNANHTKARHCEGITASSTARHTKFSVVDTSLLHGGKSSQVRELRYLPVKFDISSKIKVCSGGNEDNSSDDSSDEREQRITDGLSSHGSVVMDMKPGSKPVTADNQNPKNSCMADQGFLTHQYERTNASEDTRSNTIIKHHFSRRAKSSHSPCLVPSGKKITAPAISLASPMKGERLTAPAKTQRRHRTENISSNPIHSVSPVKRQRLNACGKIEESCFSEKFPADIHEQTELCCALKSQDDGSIEVLRVSDSEEKVSSIGSSAEGNPQSIETLQGSSEKLPLLSSDGSNPPLLPLDARNGEPGMLETDGSQLAIENDYADLSKTDATICAEDEQPMTSSRRQSKRIRPLTSKVLEALESGFLNMKRMKKVRDAQAEAMRLSSPSLKALSTVDATSKRESASDKTVEGGASICSKDVTNEPPQMAH